MSTSAVSGEGDLGVGRALGRTSELLFGNFVKFVILNGIVWLPLLVVQILLHASPVGAALGGVLTLVLNVISQAAVLFGAFQQMRGRPFEIGDSLQKGFSRFLPVLGTAICVGIAVFVGFILLFVPGVILSIMFYVAIPVCVLEGIGPFDAMGRSSELTKGSRWKIFGIALVAGLIVIIPTLIVQAILALALGWIGAVVGSYIVEVIAGVFGSIVVAVVYHDLRAAKEGIDVDRIVSVFE